MPYTRVLYTTVLLQFYLLLASSVVFSVYRTLSLSLFLSVYIYIYTYILLGNYLLLFHLLLLFPNEKEEEKNPEFIRCSVNRTKTNPPILAATSQHHVNASLPISISLNKPASCLLAPSRQHQLPPNPNAPHSPPIYLSFLPHQGAGLLYAQ